MLHRFLLLFIQGGDIKVPFLSGRPVGIWDIELYSYPRMTVKALRKSVIKEELIAGRR
jgi:hypothetical protein